MEASSGSIHKFGWLFFDIYEREDGQVAADIEVRVYAHLFF